MPDTRCIACKSIRTANEILTVKDSRIAMQILRCLSCGLRLTGDFIELDERAEVGGYHRLKIHAMPAENP